MIKFNTNTKTNTNTNTKSNTGNLRWYLQVSTEQLRERLLPKVQDKDKDQAMNKAEGLRLKQPQTKKTTQHRKGIGYPFQEKNIPKMCNYGFELVAFIINADSLIIEAVWVVMSIFTETIMEHINHEEPHL